MTPTDLQDVRAAAERVNFHTLLPSPAEHVMYQRAVDQLALAGYILATIPPDADAPVTAEWLREVWGKLGGEVDMQPGHPVFVHPDLTGCLCLYGESYDWRFDGVILATITTRHQFTQLMLALDIKPLATKE